MSGDEETCSGARGRGQSQCAIMKNLASRRQNIFNCGTPFQGEDNSTLTVMLAFSLAREQKAKARNVYWFIVRTR